MIINKLLNVTPFARPHQRKPSNSHQKPQQIFSSVLRIIHAGGTVEHYYMAIPAVRILEKYPSHVLAKPEVFKRPWDTVVQPEKVLTPGQKFLLVPVHTVRKLRQKIKRPPTSCKDHFSCASSFTSGDDDSVRDIRKTVGIKKHVTFAGIDNRKGKMRRGGKHYRRNQNALVTWQPSLTSVTE